MGIQNVIISWIEKKTGQLNDVQIVTLGLCAEHFEKNETSEIPSHLFNRIHSPSKRKKLGITYTPESVREELACRVLDHLSQAFDYDKVRISDPCCGSGAFSISVIEELVRRGLKREKALAQNIFFSDIDPFSVGLAMLNIYFHFERHGINLIHENIRINTKVQDFIRSEDRFHAFITNPPYIKLQNVPLKSREFLKNRYAPYFSGSPGLSTLFLVAMSERLIRHGAVGVITQNNLFTSNSGKSVRKLLKDKVFKIDTFGSSAVFKDVMTSTCLFYFSTDDQNEFQFRKISDASDFRKKSVLCKNRDLNPGKWRQGSVDDLENLKKLETQGIALGQACRIWVGIATQFDKAFTVFKKGSIWVSLSPDGRQIKVEAGVVKPLVRVSDLTDAESLKENKRGVIYPYRMQKDRAVAISESELKKSYPKAYQALLCWETELLKREKGRIKKQDWYKWGRIQSMIPIRQKLLTKTFNKGPRFYLDEGASLFSNGYAVVPLSTAYDILFVQKVLNSRVFDYYAKLTSVEIEGEYQCYQKNFIENFCLPNITAQDQKKLIKQKNFDRFLVKYYGLQNISV